MSPRHVTVSPLTLVAGALALALLLTPAAYAAGLAANSVGTAQLQKNAVTAVKLKKNAVNGSKIQNGTVSPADLRRGLLPPRPTALNHDLSVGQSTAKNVGGVTFILACASPGGIDRVRLTMTPGPSLDSISIAGFQGDVSSAAVFLNEETVDASLSAIPSSSGSTATTGFSGQVSANRGSDRGSALVVTVVLEAVDDSSTPCRSRITVSTT